MRGVSLGAAALLLGSSACARMSDSAVFVERDSANVRIAENGAPLWEDDGAGWHIDDAPLLDIGEREGAAGHDLTDVSGVVRLAEGSLAIANGGSSEIRVFAADGTLIHSLGRNGEGPGEFRSLDRLHLLEGDTLLAVDVRLRRISLFHGDLFVRGARLSDAPAVGAATPFLLLPDRTLLARRGFTLTPSTPAGLHRDTILLVRYDLEGAYLDSTGRYPGSENFVYDDGSNRLFGPLPLGKQSTYAPAHDGFYFGSADRYEIERRTSSGQLLQLIRVNEPTRAIAQSRIDALKEPDPSASPEDNAFARRLFAAIPLPSRYPAYRNLVADPAGYIWVMEFEEEDDARPAARVFDSNGRWLGTIALPQRFRLMSIGSDEIIGVWRDELDVEHVRVHRLHRASAR